MTANCKAACGRKAMHADRAGVYCAECCPSCRVYRAGLTDPMERAWQR